MSGLHTEALGELELKIWLNPATAMLAEPEELGSEEHPFVWHFEVTHAEDGLVGRGVRETFLEAKQTAEDKATEYLPDLLPAAEGF